MTERPIRVLLVDGQINDSRWVQEMLIDFAECRYGGGEGGQQWMRGIEVFHLDRLEETLTLLGDTAQDNKESRDAVDVILLNPALPDSFGLPTLLKVQAHAPRIPVIILSDMDDPDLAVSLVRAGAQEFLVKPELDSIPLARALRLAIERSRLVNDLRTLSWRDPLTGLYNACGLETMAAQQIATCRKMGHLLAAVLVEIGGLDELARSYGREERDLALMEAAEIMRAEIDPPAIAGFPGSCRFAAFSPATDPGEGHQLAALLRRRFHRLQSSSATLALLRIRFGLHFLEPAATVTVKDLIQEAEAGLCENMGGAPPVLSQPLTGWYERWARQTLRYVPENDEHHAVADAYRS
ncbi:MAG: diguanylate cyclase [Bryobacteraceae bacterium]|nr:diguanylate cyclase [Bryobacteraceae bacterium]